MRYGRISLSIGIGLDGGWVDWFGGSMAKNWPAPPELHEIDIANRHLTIVDKSTYEALGHKQHPEKASRGGFGLVVPDVETLRECLLHEKQLRSLLTRCSSRFVHIAGGMSLAKAALQSGLVDELDVTMYPVLGDGQVLAAGVRGSYKQLHLRGLDDGRIKSVWSRMGQGT